MSEKERLSKLKVDLKDYSNGVYYVQISGNSKSTTSKFIVAK